MKYSGIGGQAVIEGIMMKNGDRYSTAVRKPDKTIAVMEDKYESLTTRFPIFALPFFRGIFSFIDSLILGMKTLSYSSSFFEDDEDSKPSKFEEKLIKIFGDRLDKVIMGITMFISVIASIAIFMVLPMLLSNIIKMKINNHYIIAIFEGIIRIAIFIIYIKLISGMEDIKRTFMYHGAEHKCINCIEHGLELNVENVMKRCGTSFIIIVMMISILFFMVVRVDTIWLRAVSRIVLVPAIAGVSYEFLRIAGKSDFWLVNLLSKPGLWMQGLTTKEPTPDMVEVAITAVERVFDWRTYLEENF